MKSKNTAYRQPVTIEARQLDELLAMKAKLQRIMGKYRESGPYLSVGMKQALGTSLDMYRQELNIIDRCAYMPLVRAERDWSNPADDPFERVPVWE